MKTFIQSIKSLLLILSLIFTGMALNAMDRVAPKESKKELKAELRAAELDWFKHRKNNQALTIQSSVRGYLERKHLNDHITTIQSAKEPTQFGPGIFCAAPEFEYEDIIAPDLKKRSLIVDLQSASRGFLERKNTNILTQLSQLKHNSCIESLEKTISALVQSEGHTPLTSEKLSECAHKELLAIQRGAELAKRMFIDEEDLSGASSIYLDEENAHKNKSRYQDVSLKTYLQAIMDLQSFFYSLCFQIRSDGIGFDEGTFHIEDSKGLLQKFLQGYLNKISLNYTLGKEDSNHWLASNPFAYYRANSHDFKKSFGIDYRFVEDQPIEIWMIKFKHMLVAFTPQGIWLKPEHNGCSYGEVAYHGKNFFVAQWTKIKSKLTGSKGDDDERNNKERLPLKEKNEFKKLFPDYQGSMTLGAMYEHAQQTLTKKPKNSSEIQIFVNHIKKNFSHVHACYDKDMRWGNEIKLTFDELLTAYFYTTHNDALKGFFKKFLGLKHNILQFKNQNYDFAHTTQTITKEQACTMLQSQIQDFIVYEASIRNLCDNTEIQNYFTRTANTLSLIIKEKNCQALLELEPIFESDYQKDFMRSEEDKEIKRKEHDKKLRIQAQAIQQDDAEKIKLAQNIYQTIIDFCKDAHDRLDETCEFNDIKAENNISVPSLDIVQQKIENKQLCQTVIVTALDQTTGFQKTTELRMFEYRTSNPYIQSYDFKDPTAKLAKAIYAATLAADTIDKQEALILYCTKLQTSWKKTFKAIGQCAEQAGYITSLSEQGKKIIEQACATYTDKKNALLTAYEDYHNKHEHKNDDLYSIVLQEITTSYAVAEDCVKNWFMADKDAQGLAMLAQQQLNGALKPFDRDQCDIELLNEYAKLYLQGGQIQQNAPQQPVLSSDEGYLKKGYNLGASALGYMKFWN